MNLAELRIKYPKHTSAKYEPNPNCKYCHGSGERKTANKDYPVTICLCTYINDQEVVELFQDSLTKIAKEFRNGS